MYNDIHTRMEAKSNLNLSAEQQAFLAEAATLWPLAKGSLSEVRKSCTRKGCKACAEGRGHPSLIYTYREDGRLRCMHVRPSFAEELRRAIANGRQLEALLVRLGREAVNRSREDSH